MNSKARIMILVALSVLLVVGAGLLYKNLSGKYGMDMKTDSVKSDGQAANNTVSSAENTATMDSSVGDTATAASSDMESKASGSESTASKTTNSKDKDFQVYDQDGNKVMLSDYIGKPVVVNFWASWCGYCKQEMPDYQAAYEKYGQDVQFLMVQVTGEGNDTHEAGDAYITQKAYTFPVFYDDDASAMYAYSVFSFPTSLFFDKDGNLVTGRAGAMDAATIEQSIEAILP